MVLTNSTEYEKVLREAHGYAWDGEWDKALAAYKRAVALNPDAPDPYVGMGAVYAQMGRWKEAAEAYAKAVNLDPYSLPFKERLAEALAKAGRIHEAVKTYIEVSRMHRQRGNLRRALQLLSKAIKAAPQRPELHLEVAHIYEETGRYDFAAKAYVNLAAVYKELGDPENALRYCERALKLDPTNAKAQALMASLHFGEAAPPREKAPAESEGSPVDKARHYALTRLAETIFEEPKAPDGRRVDTILARALDAQRRGDVDEAILNYRLVLDTGFESADIHFNLGLLYKEKLMLEEAIRHLTKAAGHPNYALGAHFALGECYKIVGQVDRALEHFLEALKIVDLSAIDINQADALIRLYKNLADSFMIQGNRDQAVRFIQTLMNFFSARGWEDKVKELHKHLKTLEEEGIAFSLAEIMEAPNPEEVLKSLSLSEELMNRRLFASASEECMRGIASAPFCLPLHIQLAEILIKAGRHEEALNKYLLISEDYQVRGIPERAVSILKRLTRLAPMDVNIRARLIDALRNLGQVEEAVEQYIQLSETFYQLADVRNAIESLKEALQLVPHSENGRELRRKILPRLGDFYIQMMQWDKALQIYKELKSIAPEDVECRRMLLSLYARLNRAEESARETKALVELLEREKRIEEAVHILEELVAEHPQNQAFRAALADLYVKLGQNDKAVEQLDALGELQLDEGKVSEAKETIRTIISLIPDKAEGYRELLKRLEMGLV